MDELKNRIAGAGKMEKIEIYGELIKKQLKMRDKEVFKSYEIAIKIFRDYLEFDNSPPAHVKKTMLQIYTDIFGACRSLGSPQIFRKLYKEYSCFSDFFDDPRLLAILYSHFNYLFWLERNLDTALSYGLKSLKELEKCKDTRILPGRYSNVGYIYECESNFEKAEEFYEKGLQYGLRINSDQVICLAYCGYGRVNLAAGNYPLAVDYFKEALEFFSRKDHDYIAIVNNLGIALARMCKNKEAIKYFSMFINEETKKDAPDAYIDILMNCANSYLALNDFAKTESQLLEALKYAQTLDITDLITGIFVNLGNMEKKRGNWTKAIQYYKDGFNSDPEKVNKYHVMLACLGLGSAYYQMDEYFKSKENLVIALKMAEDMHQIPEVITAHELLADIYENDAEYVNALKHTKKLYDLQLKDKEDKYSLSLRQLKQDFQKKERKLSLNSAVSPYQMISRELSAKLGSPIIGVSGKMQKVLEHAYIAANNPNSPVLITGESGTGKELIARLIHYAGKRKDKPFICVNTAAFTDSLIESAFFGSEKGAFTGADETKPGYFEAAIGGSLFLDEIGDMPKIMQVKFLRVLEQKVIHRIGSVKEIPLDFRLISASNKNLHQLTENNAFRFDLLNRINTIEITIPPLKDRMDDVPVLINYFMDLFSDHLNKKRPLLSKKALDILLNYNYPGNVRELQNIIQRTLMFSQKDVLQPEDIAFTNEEKHEIHKHQFTNLNLRDNENFLIQKAMEETGHVQLKAAKLLGISPYALHRKLKRMTE